MSPYIRGHHTIREETHISQMKTDQTKINSSTSVNKFSQDAGGKLSMRTKRIFAQTQQGSPDARIRARNNLRNN